MTALPPAPPLRVVPARLCVYSSPSTIEGFEMLGDYVERFWLPVVGPTQYVLLRRLAHMAAAGPMTIEAATLSAALGVKEGTGLNSALGRGLRRLERFALIQTQDGTPDVLSVRVRTHAGTVPLYLRAEWPDEMKTMHEKHQLSTKETTRAHQAL